MKTARILIADDHELVRDGIRMRIEKHPGWTVVGEATDGRRAVELAVQHRPDVVVLDIAMSGLNGLEATRQIRRACPDTEVLILTMLESDDLVREALTAGARGFLLKTDASRQLVAAIESLLQRKPYLTGSASEVLVAGFLDSGQARIVDRLSGARLTERETEVAQLLAEGKTSKEAAVILGVSASTVEAHRANIMRKLNLHSIADLVRYAIRNRIIQP